VLKIVARVQQWWGTGQPGPGPTVPYEVVCACGQVLRGARQPRHQVVRCTGCGQPNFILPLSPLPPVEPVAAPGPSREPPAGPIVIPRPWCMPLTAAALTLTAVVLFYVLLLASLRQRGSSTGPVRAEQVRSRIQAGQQALAEGKYRLAVEELSTARQLRDQRPQLLTARENRELNQLYRQAALLDNLLDKSLQEILSLAQREHDQEWPAQFAGRYKGKAVIFYDRVRRDATGAHRLLVYEVRVGDEVAHVELADLKLLSSLPLDKSPRLLFGARLASVSREAPGPWVIRFEPDSGVLLTDPGAVASCCPPPWDEELQAVLKRQAEWLADLP